MKLTRNEHIVYDMLSDGRLHTHEALWQALYGHKPEADWPDSNIVKVYVCVLRRKTGAEIENHNSVGYRMTNPKPPEIWLP